MLTEPPNPQNQFLKIIFEISFNVFVVLVVVPTLHLAKHRNRFPKDAKGNRSNVFVVLAVVRYCLQNHLYVTWGFKRLRAGILHGYRLYTVTHFEIMCCVHKLHWETGYDLLAIAVCGYRSPPLRWPSINRTREFY